MLAFVGRDRSRFWRQLRDVGLFLVSFQRLNEIRHGIRAEHPRQPDDGSHPHTRSARIRDGRARFLETSGPDLRMAPLVAGNTPEGGGADGILFDLGKSVVKDDRVAFELEVGEARLALLFGQLKGCLCH